MDSLMGGNTHVMLGLFFMGYGASAAAFYALLAKTAPIVEPDVTELPVRTEAEIIELFPAEADIRIAA